MKTYFFKVILKSYQRFFIDTKTIMVPRNLNVRTESAYERGLLRNYAFVFTTVEIFFKYKRLYEIRSLTK